MFLLSPKSLLDFLGTPARVVGGANPYDSRKGNEIRRDEHCSSAKLIDRQKPRTRTTDNKARTTKNDDFLLNRRFSLFTKSLQIHILLIFLKKLLTLRFLYYIFRMNFNTDGFVKRTIILERLCGQPGITAKFRLKYLFKKPNQIKKQLCEILI